MFHRTDFVKWLLVCFAAGLLFPVIYIVGLSLYNGGAAGFGEGQLRGLVPLILFFGVPAGVAALVGGVLSWPRLMRRSMPRMIVAGITMPMIALFSYIPVFGLFLSVLGHRDPVMGVEGFHDLHVGIPHIEMLVLLSFLTLGLPYIIGMLVAVCFTERSKSEADEKLAAIRARRDARFERAKKH